MRIQHNIMAMNAYRNYSNNTSALSKNLEKLSSGYKINRAGDDAAGLAISEKMRAQITGLETAQKNAKDGISLVQTAEGALTEVHDMLNRMVELADQSANGTYDNEVDRANLQKEVDQLREEINRIADSANFNGINLLDGNLSKGTTQLGDAFNKVAISSVDGTTATAATTASFKIDLSKDVGADGSIFATLTSANGTAQINAIAVTLGDGTTTTLGQLFTVKTNANSVFTIEAQTAGALTQKVLEQLTASKAVSVTSQGSNIGSGSPATKAEYKLEFDFNDMLSANGGTKFTIGDKTFQILKGGSTADLADGVIGIDISAYNLGTSGGGNTVGQWGAANEIFNTISNALGTANFEFSAAPTANAPGNDTYTLTFKAKEAGSAGNMGEVRFVDATGTATNSAGGITATYTEGKDAGKATAGSFAQVTYELNLNQFSVGDKLSITTPGSTGAIEVEIVDAADADPTKGKITLQDFQNGTKLAQVFEGMGVGTGMLSFADGKLTITGTTEGQTAEDLADSITIDATCANDGAEVTNNGLTLQIGDTSDDFNQLQVSIDDMHTDALGIDTLSIADQDSAAKAVDLIKGAINKVSSVRGTLGATQNRLDHTINNLSVMTENIQDAESTIRDTDVADEMMAYTKNNILIQSAQAMLAQANQVPQGVLQLLQ